MARKSGLKHSLTQVDLQIIQAVYHFRALYGYQMRALLNLSPTSKYLNQRLGFLCKNHYLQRFYNQLHPGSFRGYAYYQLDRLSVGVLSHVLGISTTSVRWQRRDNQLSYANHGRELNDVVIATQKVTPYPSQFYSEILATTPFVVPGQGDVIFRPDGLLVFHHQGFNAYHYLERERTLEQHHHFLHKLKTYEQFWEHQFRQQFQAQDFRVLFIANDQIQLEKLRTLTLSQHLAPRYYFSTLPVLLQGNFFASVWKGLEDDHWHALF